MPFPIESDDSLRPVRPRPPADTVLIDLNADVGEGYPDETKVMYYVSSVSVACGGHAGDVATLRRTLNTALQHGLALGAHPGYEDREHMGRQPLDLPVDELQAMLQRQLLLFGDTLKRVGGKWQHVKLHGALYHQAAEQQTLAESVIAAMRQICPGIYLFCQPRGWLYCLAAQAGIPVVPEYFADRGYRPDGSLIPRSEPGALISDPSQVMDNVARMARQHYDQIGGRRTADALHPTFCLHSDSPNAIQLARWLRIGLSRAHIDVAAYPLP